VSRADRKGDASRQLQRLQDYAAARGYQVVAEVTEIASGLNDERPELKKLLSDAKVGVLLVEHTDRLTRCGYGDIVTLLNLGAAGAPSGGYLSQRHGRRSDGRLRSGH
jgi:putative resolvase